MSRFRFSVGPWNVHSGADSYGPATRAEIDFDTKLAKFAELGFSAIQFQLPGAVRKPAIFSMALTLTVWSEKHTAI